MKIYISGKISGLPTDIAEENFRRSEELLQAIGFETVNPMREIANKHREWIDYICDDYDCSMIAMLFICNRIGLNHKVLISKGRLQKQKASVYFMQLQRMSFAEFAKLKVLLNK